MKINKTTVIVAMLVAVFCSIFTYRVNSIRKYSQYQIDDNVINIDDVKYIFVHDDDDIMVTKELDVIGIAVDDKLGLYKYIFPHTIKNVETNLNDISYVMVSGPMWDGLYKKVNTIN